jgi:hypothetical protein
MQGMWNGFKNTRLDDISLSAHRAKHRAIYHTYKLLYYVLQAMKLKL